MIKALVLLAVFIFLALIISVFQLIDKLATAIDNRPMKKYTVYYRKPLESSLVSYYRTIMARGYGDCKKRIKELEYCCIIKEIERC